MDLGELLPGIVPSLISVIFFCFSRVPYSAKRALEFIVETYRKDGFFSLWRGNTATLARIMPYAAINFTAHEQWKRILQVDNKTG